MFFAKKNSLKKIVRDFFRGCVIFLLWRGCVIVLTHSQVFSVNFFGKHIIIFLFFFLLGKFFGDFLFGEKVF